MVKVGDHVYYDGQFAGKITAIGHYQVEIVHGKHVTVLAFLELASGKYEFYPPGYSPKDPGIGPLKIGMDSGQDEGAELPKYWYSMSYKISSAVKGKSASSIWVDELADVPPVFDPAPMSGFKKEPAIYFLGKDELWALKQKLHKFYHTNPKVTKKDLIELRSIINKILGDDKPKKKKKPESDLKKPGLFEYRRFIDLSDPPDSSE
jgi:hypothetical protein